MNVTITTEDNQYTVNVIPVGKGADGTSIRSGARDPVEGDGNDGDFWINTATTTLFGPKASGSWGGGVLLIGPKGNDNITVGPNPPDSPEENDIWIDTN
jgi:hypothetical protein